MYGLSPGLVPGLSRTILDIYPCLYIDRARKVLHPRPRRLRQRSGPPPNWRYALFFSQRLWGRGEELVPKSVVVLIAYWHIAI